MSEFVFVPLNAPTSSFSQSDHGTVREGFERSLKLLDIEYIDLYLMHWPQANTKDGEYN